VAWRRTPFYSFSKLYIIPLHHNYPFGKVFQVVIGSFVVRRALVGERLKKWNDLNTASGNVFSESKINYFGSSLLKETLMLNLSI
jgi:hypothetical protein